MYNVLMVVGIIQSEMIGTTSRVPAYSGNKMGRTWGTINIPINNIIFPSLFNNSILFIFLLTLIGICVGSYIAIKQSLKKHNYY